MGKQHKEYEPHLTPEQDKELDKVWDDIKLEDKPDTARRPRPVVTRQTRDERK